MRRKMESSTSGPALGINCSLSDALDNVGPNLVYDPVTKKLCFKTTNGQVVGSRNSLVQQQNYKLNEQRDDDDVEDLFVCAKVGQLVKDFSTVAKIVDDDEKKKQEVDDPVTMVVVVDPIKRPENLPPKPPEEERKHRQEFLELLQNVKRKDLKEKRLKRLFTAKQARQEAEIQRIIRIWTEEILPNWPTVHCTKRVQELWWHGIPAAVRPKIWNLVIRNELHITEQLFHICVQRSREKIWTKNLDCNGVAAAAAGGAANTGNRRSSNPTPAATSPEFVKTHRRTASHHHSSAAAGTLLNLNQRRRLPVQSTEEDGAGDQNDENVAFLIKLDVLRTFPQLGLFQEDGPYHQSLCDILSAYVVYRPDLGYCQGMSFLAAMLLLNTETPAAAFVALANLLNNELLLAFYGLNQDRMQATYVYYDRHFHRLLPALARHFAAIGLTTDLFFMYQVYTVFARSLSFDCVCRVWDLFLRDGNEFIIRASLAILSLYQKELLQLEFIDSAKFLARLPDDMDVERFFEIIAGIRLTGSGPKLATVLAGGGDLTTTTTTGNDSFSAFHNSDPNGGGGSSTTISSTSSVSSVSSSSSTSSPPSSKYSLFVKKILPF